MSDCDNGEGLRTYIQNYKKWDQVYKLLPKGSFHNTYYEWHTGILSCTIYNKEENDIGGFKLLSLPYAPGLMFSYEAYLISQHQGKGIGRLLREIKDECVDTIAGGILFCTVRADNAKQIHLLETMRWREVASYTNYCSCEEQLVYMKAGPGASIYA
jgi:GNAT superfamily N-acetyltransferase